MRNSYNEFHVSKKMREECAFSERLFASSGNVIIQDMKNIRLFAKRLNSFFIKNGEKNKQISAGSLNAMGLIDEIFHYVCMLFRRDAFEGSFKNLLKMLDDKLGKENVDSLLLDFSHEFPPTEVYKGKISDEEYLFASAFDEGTKKERTNREQTLEEFILLRLANENPAFSPFIVLFDDKQLKKNAHYEESWTYIKEEFKKMPPFGPFSHDLITMLKEPVVFSPTSLRGQLDYIIANWGYMLKDILKRLLTALGTLNEEAKAAWHPVKGTEVNMEAYNYESLLSEYERFSPDREWMPCVILMAKTVLVWLDQLSKKYKRNIARLDEIPDEELDLLRERGFNALWLIGLWQRSEASKRIKQICGNAEAAASAYSLHNYEIAENIGGWLALSNLRTRLWQRGIRLASDMVPNHTGMDSDWVVNRPSLFITRRDAPSYTYTFNGENLSRDGRVSIFLEDHYYNHTDCAVVFKRVDNSTGEVSYIYHGNDGTGMPWNDTAQIDFLNPEAREAVMQEILHVARNFPIIRFDAAMVLAKKSIRRLWYPEPGRGGDIYTRSESGLTNEEFEKRIPNEFWREVVDRVAKEVPDTLLLAEAFWMMEGYFVRTLGMHRVYNSAFMNMLKKEENQKYKDTVKNTIKFDRQILKRYVNFMNNPDEETAEAQFGKGDKYFGVCTLMVTMPGLPMFGHGQIEGFTEKYGMEFTKAYKNEEEDRGLIDRHYREIFPLMRKRYIYANVDDFLFFDVWNNASVNENVFAYSNGANGEYSVVFYNNKYEGAQGWIKTSCEYAVKKDGETVLETRTLAEGLSLTPNDNRYLIFKEQKSSLYFVRKSREIAESGMFVSLNGFECQILVDIHEVEETVDGKYGVLYNSLQGKGCKDLEREWQEIAYRPLYDALEKYLSSFIPPLYEEFSKETNEKISSDSKKTKKESAIFDFSSLKEASETFFRESSSFMQKGENACEKKALGKQNRSLFALLKALQSIKMELAKTKKRVFALEKCTNNEEFLLFAAKNDENLLERLACFALVAHYAMNGDASRYAFARKIAEFFEKKNFHSAFLQDDLQKIFLLAENLSEIVREKDEKEMIYRLLNMLTKGKEAAFLSGANEFGGTLWFNDEKIHLSLVYAFCVLILSKKDLGNAFSSFKQILKALKKSDYKAEALLLSFAKKNREKNKKEKKKTKKN